MSRRDFDLEELRRAVELLPQPTEEQITEWADTGLNNVDFVRHFLDTGQWPTWVVVEDA